MINIHFFNTYGNYLLFLFKINKNYKQEKALSKNVSERALSVYKAEPIFPLLPLFPQ
jgi:hypothetical protein